MSTFDKTQKYENGAHSLCPSDLGLCDFFLFTKLKIHPNGKI